MEPIFLTQAPGRTVGPGRGPFAVLLLFCMALALCGCRTPAEYRQEADKTARQIIAEKQQEALGKTEPLSIKRPKDILRRRLLEEQDLQYSSEASLGTDRLDPIEHWPEADYPRAESSPDAEIPIEPNQPLKLSLIDALQIGARNSDEYQSRKEDVFRAAFALDVERNEFRNFFVSRISSAISADTTEGIGRSDARAEQDTSATARIDRTLKNGASLSAALAVDLANLLTQGGSSTIRLAADPSVSIPLLRGSGRHIVTEPLTQAERQVIYTIWEFERFKRTFAVNIAQQYFSVLSQMDGVKNAEENYRGKIRSSRRSRRWADAGRLPAIQVDQAIQSELGARSGWIRSQLQLKNSLDSFKRLIGLPPDARVEIDRSDLDRLTAPASQMVADIVREATLEETARETPPADAEVILEAPNYEEAGPYELEETVAIQLALENRLDLHAANGRVYDAQRRVVIAADRLRAELTLGGAASFDDNDDDGSLGFDGGTYSALLTLDLPLERTAEQYAYRESWINLEDATRSVQSLEDNIKLSIRNELRTLLESREALKIEAMSVAVAEKRVRSVDLYIEAGRAEIRDLLEAQDALLSAQNALTRAVVDYRMAELEIQRDMGLLEMDANGLWREFSPEDMDHGTKQ